MASTATAPTPSAAPEVKGGVVPYLSVADSAAAAEFYQRAFAAEEVARASMPGETRIIHLHLYINGGSLMLGDPFPEHGQPLRQPQAFNLHLQVDDADAWFDRAVKAGAEPLMAVQPMFWGDRYGQVKDPFGVTWAFGATPA